MWLHGASKWSNTQNRLCLKTLKQNRLSVEVEVWRSQLLKVIYGLEGLEFPDEDLTIITWRFPLQPAYSHLPLLDLCPAQVLPGRLPHRRLHQRLPRRLLSALRRAGLWRPGRALHPLHGELRRLQLLWPHRQGFQTLGMQQASVAQRAAEVLREVPALHPLLPGLWVSPRQRVLLHLWVRRSSIHWNDCTFDTRKIYPI